MLKSNTIDKLAAAMNLFQAEVETVKKDGTNPFFKSHYATLENVIETVRPYLLKHGLSFSQFPDGDGLTTILMHSSGEFLEANGTMKPKDDTPQALGSAMTYARRYALCAILGLATEDDDGNAGSVKASVSPKIDRTAPKDDMRLIAAKDRIKTLLTKLGYPLASKSSKSDYVDAVNVEIGEDLNAATDLASLEAIGQQLAEKVAAQK